MSRLRIAKVTEPNLPIEAPENANALQMLEAAVSVMDVAV